MFEINGIDWEIEWCEPTDDNLRRSDGSLTVGVTDNRTKCIYLSDQLSGAFLRKVFIHEVCHCAIFSYGIYIDIEQEEFLCDFIATYGDEIFEIVDGIFYAIKKIVA